MIIHLNHSQMNIAVFASGSGSNAENIVNRLNRPGSRHRVSLIVTNRRDAGVIERAARLGVTCEIIDRATLADEAATGAVLDRHGVEFIALGGFLAMIPAWMIARYPRRIVNIHPSLLPRHGGKGMWGHHVHEAVHAAGDKESGITIHYVDEHYDSGDIIFQDRVAIGSADSAADIEAKVRALEPLHYPAVVESLLDALQQK